MAGIYIHVPFCKTKCGYCDFYSNNQLNFRQDYVNSIIKEIDHQYLFIKTDEISTIYFGGGTPSQLSIDDCQLIIEKMQSRFLIKKDAELTFEANPDDLNATYLKELLQIGINRISIGVQTFDDDGLKFMNRRHTSSQAFDSVLLAHEVGFENITIDLIYGYPGLSDVLWEKNLEKAFSLPIKHLSAYHLIIEQGTPFYKHKLNKKLFEVDESVSEKHYEILCNEALENGFEHYEISNFCKPGYESKHNSSYWNGTPYLGLGPSAHSFDGNNRRNNVANTQQYIELVDSKQQYWQDEILTEKDRINEYIMIHLRTSKGIDLDEFEKVFGKKHLQRLIEIASTHKKPEKMGQYLRICEKDLLVSDPIISALFL